MDNKFLDKVLDQLVSETRIDYGMGEIQFPFSIYFLSRSSYPFFLFPSIHSLFFSPSFFSKHCKEIYGLNKEETEYVWDEYKEIIKNKIGG